jgi:hypothetical protein
MEWWDSYIYDAAFTEKRQTKHGRKTELEFGRKLGGVPAS